MPDVVAPRAAAERPRPLRRRGRRLRHRRRVRSARGGRAPAPACFCWSSRRSPAVRRRWPAATSTSAAAPRCRRRPVTTTPRGDDGLPDGRHRIRTRRRSAPTARAASSTSTGWRALGFEFERSLLAGEGRHPARHRGPDVHGQREGAPRSATSPAGPRGHKVPVPGDTEGTRIVMDLLRTEIEEAGVDVRYETGATQPRQSTATRSSACAGVASRRPGTVRLVRRDGRRRLRDEPRHGGGVHLPQLGEKPFMLGIDVRRRPGHPPRPVGRRRTQHMDEPFITAPFYPPSQLVKGLIVNS